MFFIFFVLIYYMFYAALWITVIMTVGAMVVMFYALVALWAVTALAGSALYGGTRAAWDLIKHRGKSQAREHFKGAFTWLTGQKAYFMKSQTSAGAKIKAAPSPRDWVPKMPGTRR